MATAEPVPHRDRVAVSYNTEGVVGEPKIASRMQHHAWPKARGRGCTIQ